MTKIKTLCLSFIAGIALSCSPSVYTVEVNPTPHDITITNNQVISTKDGFHLVDCNEKLTDALTFANADKKGLSLTVDFGEELSAKHGVAQIDGAYSLSASERGVEIIGYNERGAFYGIQTLLQLTKNDQIATLTINDFPDIPYRGVVEGFYGTPWSHAVRLSLIHYYGEYKMNSYLYGPKDDPYHSSPYWREPYPEKEAQNIKELVDVSNENRLDFIWAIHPGKDIKWNEEDYSKLLAKFESMYDLGVRSFALFFDDISGPGTSAVKQAELLNRLHNEFVTVKGDVKPLILCPTDYTKLWADPKPDGYLSILGNTLDPSIHVMWTGDAICCDITDGTLEWVNSRIKRPTFIWWNYPVTDYVKHIIMQGPVYGNSQKASKEDMVGFVSNPMEHGEASKIALYGVADYTWNIDDYKPLENWERALEDLMPEAKEAYKTFAINSTDTETGYRRDESWEVETFKIDNYTKGQYDSLYAEFSRIKEAPATIFAKSKNELLVGELKPWLVEFEKLGERGVVAMDLIKLYESGDYEKFWELYSTTNMTDEQLVAYKEHRSGTYKLTPFINTTRKDLAMKLYSQLSGKPVYETRAISSFENIDTELSALMFDGNTNTHYTSAEAQKDGSWIGLDLGHEVNVSHIYIEQGRNNTNDVDYFDSAKLELSLDGKEWVIVKDNMKKEYLIDIKIAPIKARYVRLSRLDESERQNWFTVRRFEINPVASAPTLNTNIAQLDGRKVEQQGKKVAMSKVLEVIRVAPGYYFGIEMPMVVALDNVEVDLGGDYAVEYSSDGDNWSPSASSAKYVRYTNRGDKAVEVKIDAFSFDVASSGDKDLSLALDEDIKSFYRVDGSTIFAVADRAKECVILSSLEQGSKVSIKQLAADGRELKSEPITSKIATFTVADGATTIEISGSLDIYEVIFK